MRRAGHLLFLLVLFGATVAQGRVGGGQHYSSPARPSSSSASRSSGTRSSSSSGSTARSSSSTFSPGSSRSSSGASQGSGAPVVFVPMSRPGSGTSSWTGLMLLLVLVVLVVVLVIAFRRAFGVDAATQRRLQESDALARLHVTEADRAAWVAALQQRDPGFRLPDFLARVQALFLATQEAWSGGDLVPVRRFLSDATWLRFRVQLGLLHIQGVRNVTTQMAVTGLELVGLEQNAWFDTLHVLVRARARDTDVPADLPDASARAEAARAPAQDFTEVWSLVRKPGVLSAGGPALAAGACPSCGAPFEGGAASSCPYCKAVVNSGAYDWVLAEITQTVEVVRADAPVPGLPELRARDPGLSLEVLEDRASLVFWRWVEAQSTGQPERMARLAQGGLVERLRSDVLRLTAQGARRVFLECAVGEVRVRAFEDTPDARTLAHVEVRWSARTGVGPLGEPAPRLPVLPQRWVFTLVRGRDATSRVEQGMSTDRCPQCGGPLGDALLPNCEWCATLLEGDLRDWTLVEAGPVESWEGRGSLARAPPMLAADVPDVEDRERLLYTLAAMAMADGVVDASERRLLHQFAERWGLPASQVEEALASDLGTLESLLPDVHAGEPFLRTLAQLARVDGEVDAAERRMLASVAGRLGLSQRLPTVLASVGVS